MGAWRPGVRWRKVARDLWGRKTRTLLVVLAISIGALAVGAVLGAYSVLSREIPAGYMGTNPASATLVADRPLSYELVREARARPGIADAEAGSTVVARAEVGPGQWRPLFLFAVDDFEQQRVSTFEPESGAWPPPGRGMLVERAALGVLRAGVGGGVAVEMPGGERRTLEVAGTVHDPGVSPGWQGNVGYGYVSPETLAWLGADGLDEMKIVVSGDRLDGAHVDSVARNTEKWMESKGYRVSRVEIPPPGEQPYQAQMNGLLFTLGAFGAMILALGGVLVANVVSALLSRQIGQIGAMKAVGARTGQLVFLYLGMVLVMSLAALVVAVPAGALAARALSRALMAVINLDVEDYRVSPWVFAAQVSLGLLIPLLVSALPVRAGCRVTVREAIGGPGIGARDVGRRSPGLAGSVVGRLPGTSRPFLLSLRNAFGRRSRLVLTLAALSAGGAVFAAAMNVSTSWERTLDATFGKVPYDATVLLAAPARADRLEEIAEGVPGVEGAEAWGYARVAPARRGEVPVDRSYPDGHGTLGMVGVPPGTGLARPKVVEGRWLKPGDANAVVVSRAALEGQADPEVGDNLALAAGGAVRSWRVVGIVEELGAPAAAYTTLDAFDRATGQKGEAGALRVVAQDHDSASQAAVVGRLEDALSRAGIGVSLAQPAYLVRDSLQEHVVILVGALMAMAAIAAAVGVAGLVTTMGVGVQERVRELGVMRAVGARPRDVLGIVVAEGVLIGTLSWLVALALSVPLSAVVGVVVGRLALGVPLGFAVSWPGALLWLAIVVVLATAASFSPAWKASRLSVGEELAYE